MLIAESSHFTRQYVLYRNIFTRKINLRRRVDTAEITSAIVLQNDREYETNLTISFHAHFFTEIVYQNKTSKISSEIFIVSPC